MNNYENNYGLGQSQSVDAIVSQTMKQVYFRMFLALLVTAFVSMWATGSEMFWSILLNNSSAFGAAFDTQETLRLSHKKNSVNFNPVKRFGELSENLASFSKFAP